MAIIGKSEVVPKQEFLPKLFPPMPEDEVLVFLRPDHQFFTATNITLSVMATCIARYGLPVKATDILKVSQIGIFSNWEIKRKLGELCDKGYFSRTHIGTEEYFAPESAFLTFLDEAIKLSERKKSKKCSQ